MRPTRDPARSPVLVLVLGIGGLAAGAAVLLRRLDAVLVRGTSMAPALLPGDRLIAVRADRPPRVGDVVLAPDPRWPERELVKRVAAVDGSRIRVRGDNPASTDSRTFGDVAAEGVRWRIVGRYWPLGRIGRVPPAPATPVIRGCGPRPSRRSR